MKKFLLIFVVLLLPIYATCDPPGGAWTILNGESCSNSSIQINSTSDITVNAGGYLYLNNVSLWVGRQLLINGRAHFTNVTVVMNDTTEYGAGGAKVEISATGEFNITNQSRVQLGDTANAYYAITTLGGGALLINDTILTGLNTDTASVGGLALHNGNVVVENSSLSSVDADTGPMVYDSSDGTRFYNVSITSNGIGIHTGWYLSNYYDNISIVSIGTGVTFEISNNAKFNNSYIESTGDNAVNLTGIHAVFENTDMVGSKYGVYVNSGVTTLNNITNCTISSGGAYADIYTNNAGYYTRLDTVNFTGGNVVDSGAVNAALYFEGSNTLHGNLRVDGYVSFLTGAIIRMNGTIDGEFNIDVLNGGTLNVEGATITNGDTPAAEYNFWYRDGSYGMINDTIVEELYSGSFGISIDDSNGNVGIENSTIRNSESNGIFLAGGAIGIRIYNNSIYNNDGSGISILWRSNIISYNNISSNLAEGIRIDAGARYNSITDNTISNETTGIWITTGSARFINITRNTIFNITTYAIHMEGDDSNISHNIISNSSTGVYIDDADNLIFLNNTIHNSSAYGIQIERADDVVASNNTISNSSIYGIFLDEANGATLLNNNISNSTISGIHLNQTIGTVVLDDNIIQNNTIGIQFAWYSDYVGIGDIINNNTLSNNNITLTFNNTNATVGNATMPTAVNWNATLSHNSQITLENVSHTVGAINVSDTSLLTAYWYLDVNTLTVGSSNLDGVSITGTDQYSNVQFTEISSSGQIPTQLTEEYYINSTITYDYDPYTITGALTGYYPNSSILSLGSNNATTLVFRSTGGEGNGDDKDDEDDVEDEKEPEEETFDDWMKRYDLDDGDGDPDDDGLTNKEEYELGTDPTKYTQFIIIVRQDGGGGGSAPLTKENKRIVPINVKNASFVIENEFGGTSIGAVLAGGEERIKRILIYNTGTESVTVKLDCVGSVFTDKKEKLTQSNDVCSWITFNQTEIDLIPNPQQKIPIDVTIKVPENTSEREYYFSIVGNAIGSETAYSFPFLIDVSEFGSGVLNMFLKLGKVCWVGGPEGSAPIPLPIGGVIVLLSFVTFFIVKSLAKFGPKDKDDNYILEASAPFIFIITFLLLLWLIPSC